MQSSATSVARYLASLPADRQEDSCGDGEGEREGGEGEGGEAERSSGSANK